MAEFSSGAESIPRLRGCALRPLRGCPLRGCQAISWSMWVWRCQATLVLGLLLVAETARSEIYRWVDEDGRTHFSQDLGRVPRHQRADAQNLARGRPLESPIQRYDPSPARRAPSRALASEEQAAETYLIPVTRAGTSMIVTVRLNNRVNARFLVDTGATDVLLPQRVADELGLQPSGRTKLYSTANGTITQEVVLLDSVALGGATAKGVVASISRSMDIGLLGLSFFNHFRYAIDPVAGVIRLTSNGLAEAGGIRSGRSRAQWKAEYAGLRSRIRFTKDRRERVLSSHTRTRGDLEDQVKDLERQLSVLDSEADRARVPYSWRR